jgi:hypothetical protein
MKEAKNTQEDDRRVAKTVRVGVYFTEEERHNLKQMGLDLRKPVTSILRDLALTALADHQGGGNEG